MTEPTTEAGRRLGLDVEQELGVQFKSADMYRGWLATANALATAIEAEARATLLDDLTLAAGSTFAPGAALDSVLAILAAGEDPS